MHPDDIPSGEFGNIHDLEQFLSQPLAHDGTEIIGEDSHTPQYYDPLVGGALLNPPYHDFHELPYHDMMDIDCHPYSTPFDMPFIMGSAPPQQQFDVESQLFPEPYFQLASTSAMPSAPMEFDFPSGPQHSPGTMSLSGPPTPSVSPMTPLNRVSQSPGFTGSGPVMGMSSRLPPSSPSPKRPLEPDDSLHGRRIIPRLSGSSNVHSATSASMTIPSATPSTIIITITSRVPGRGLTIPQSLYKVGISHSFHLTPDITFDVATANGIPLQQLLDRQSFLLNGYDEQISDMSGDTASIRIEWPGYLSFTKQISSKNWRKTRAPNTRATLAMKVAGAIKAFFQKHANTPCEPPNSMWRIGVNGIRVEDLVLVSLHRVSQGSWQPKLCLVHDNAQQ